MRNNFKQILEENCTLVNQAIGDDIDHAWKFASKSCDRVDICLHAIPDGQEFDERKRDCLLILRNLIADLCCCLDSLERGHTRTLQNNLRMSMEDFALAVMLESDDKTYELFKNGEKVSGSKAIGYMKNHEHGHEMFGSLWGSLSEISHHTTRNLIARQTVSITPDGVLQTLIKKIDHNDVKHQLVPLLDIVFLFRSIGEYAERICIHLITDHYFWSEIENGYQQNLNISLDPPFQRLLDKCASLLRD